MGRVDNKMVRTENQLKKYLEKSSADCLTTTIIILSVILVVIVIGF